MPTKKVIVRVAGMLEGITPYRKQQTARPNAPIGTMPNSMLRPESFPASRPPIPIPNAAIGNKYPL